MSTADKSNFSILDFVRGCIGGATGLLISHPVDTIKSNIQDGRQIRWGIHHLYKGVRAPLLGVGLEKAVVFGTYENCHRLLQSNNYSYSYSYSYFENIHLIRLLSGASAGFMASFIVTPVERLKILAQTNEVWTNRDLNIRFLYRGLSSTFTRETPGFAIYFSVFEGLKDYFSQKIELNLFYHFAFGGLSGATAWMFIYPQDLVKTKVQASKEKITPIQVISVIYRQNGIRGLFKGFHLALLRAVPLHAGTFAMVEFLKQKF